jgi:Na+-transporting NADH:ubiquinone oxidoreductase subunit A
MSSQAMEALMLESGMWTALRARPFGRSPKPGTRPEALFVTAMDTEPLAADPEAFLATRSDAFVAGIKGLVSLAGGCPVHLCRKPGSSIPGGDVPGVEVHEFAGPHPAGTAGLHMHLVAPVTAEKVAWYIGYQDVWALGQLLLTGKLCVERVVPVVGPAVAKPVLWKTRLGAEVAPLVTGRLTDGESRIVNGSALYGRQVDNPVGFLGRFFRQLTVLPEDRSRPFLGWMAPGGDRFSILPLFLGWLTQRGKKIAFSTRMHGSHRAVVPFGAFEKVFPFDTHAVFLLRALLGGDLPLAQELGVLELDEEDLALCTFACPGKNDYGQALREVLTTIEKEG